MATDDLKKKPATDPNQTPEFPEEAPENEFQAALQKLGKWWDKYANYVLIIMIIVCGTVLGRKYYHQYQENQRSKSWGELALASTPDQARQLAEEFDNPAFAAVAYLYAGDLHLQRAFLAVGNAGAPMPEKPAQAQPVEPAPAPVKPAGEAAAPAPAPEGATSTVLAAPLKATYDRQKDLQQARAMYEKVLAIADADELELIKLNAKLGLGAVAEEERDATQAARWYDQVVGAAGKYPHVAAQAKSRRDMASMLARPVVFGVEAPKPVKPAGVIDQMLQPNPGAGGDVPNPLMPALP